MVEDKYLLAKQNETPSHFLKQFHLPKVGMSRKQGLVRCYSVPGAFPQPDDQGYSLFCSRFALAKAICNGFMVIPSKFHMFDLDFSQGEISAVLVNKHKVMEMEIIN